MILSMPRVLALVLTAALTLTPAVVGACAVMWCAPGWAVQAESDAGHHGHHEPVAPAAHAHHDMGQAAAVAAPSAHVRGVPDHECCAGAARTAVVAVVTSRLDAGAVPDAVTPNRADVARDAGHQHSPPSRAHARPPQPVPASVVLRI
jgi:hypothetical protein